MAFRFPIRIPKTLDELFGWLRELLPQLEIKVLKDRQIETTTTAIAHGLGSVPVFVRTSNPHCISIIRKAKAPDKNCVYLRATNKVVADVWVASIGAIGESLVKNGGYHYPDWDPEGDALGDHKFSVDAADETADGYDYAEKKLLGSSTVALTKVTGSHGKAIQFTAANQDDHLVKARNADATTVGGLMEKTIDSPTIERTLTVDGDGNEVVAFNTLAQADPISFESTLYAAHLDDPALFSPVVCAFYKIVGGGGNFATSFNPDYTEWQEIRPGVFKSTVLGQGSIRDYIPDGITPVAGMRVASVNPTEYPMSFAYDRIRTGVYIITNPGYTGVVGEPGYSVDYAVLERAPELDASADFASGCVFQVTQGEGAGKYFRLTNTQPINLGTDELTWEMLDSYTPTASDNLLTAAQLARASDTSNTTALVASDGSPSAPLDFPTLAGTPNLDTYKAGRTEVHVLARLHIAGSAGSVTWLECKVIRDPGGDEEVLETISTSPITNTADEIIKAHIDDDEDQDLAGDRIGLRIVAKSDSSTPAAIAVTWSDPAHSTRLLTPMTLAVGGSDDHQADTPVSRGFVAGEEADARAFGHPQRYIAPGRILTPSNPMVTTADGLFAVPANSNYVEVDGTDDVIGISTTGWTGTNSKIDVFFFYQRVLKRGQTVPDGYAPLAWGTGEAGYGVDIDTLTVYADCVVSFRLIGGRWRIVGMLNL